MLSGGQVIRFFTVLLSFISISNYNAVSASPITLPSKIIVGYANWGQCDDKIITAVKQGVNVLIWFSLNLESTVDPVTGERVPYIHLKSDIDCIIKMKKHIKEDLKLDTIHMISIGGWNAPHPDTRVSPLQMFNAFHKWNSQFNNDGVIFDGIDWDIEGHDDLSHTQNDMTLDTIHFIGKFSTLAKNASYLVSMAPAESYLDPTTSEFDLSLRHAYTEWQHDVNFTYHGRNTYAPILVLYHLVTFDFITIQLYEAYSHTLYQLRKKNVLAETYIPNLVAAFANGWNVDFSEISGKLERLHVPRSKLVIGLGNGWARNKKFLLLSSTELSRVVNAMGKGGVRGYAFWNIKDEGVQGIHYASTLNSLLNVRKNTVRIAEL